MKPNHDTSLRPLASYQLPGPDTDTKRDALRSLDPRLQLMLHESAHIGWPIGFSNDLYLHDRDTLANYPEQSLIWILRENGTHLYPTVCDTAGEAAYYRRVIAYWSGDDNLNFASNATDKARFYRITANTLTTMTWREASDAIKVRCELNPREC